MEPTQSTADHRCGDPTCEVCVPPSSACETCGALTWGLTVPYCSSECAIDAERRD